MTAPLGRVLIKKYNLSVGSFSFYKNFIVAEINEGIAFTFENATKLLDLTKTYYGNKTPFVYITNRINSYSFNPTAHFKTAAMFPNLKGFASVTYDPINHEIAEMEKSFFTKPARNFRSLEEAINWVEELIEMD